MKTWILCFNKRGASVYMRRDDQEKLSSLDLFYSKQIIDRKTKALQDGFVAFLIDELRQLSRSCGSQDLLFVSAETTFAKQVLLNLEEKVRNRISKVINEDLRSTPTDYISKYTKDSAELQAS